RAVVEHLANDVARQPVVGRVAGERAVPEPQEAAAKRADPERAVGIRQDRPDRKAALGVVGTKRGEAPVLVAVDRAVTRSDPDGAVSILGEGAYVAALETILGTKRPAPRAIDPRQAVLRTDPDRTGAIDEKGLDAMDVRSRARDPAPIEDVQILVPRAHPQPT